MASNVSIANQALRQLGANPIIDFSDPTTEGQLVNDTFDFIRDRLIRDHPWNFAMKRALLAESATSPVWGDGLHAYPVPDDYVRAIEVNGQIDYDFQIEHIDGIGRVFVTELESPLNLRYIYEVTDPELFDPQFANALSKECAAEWAEPLTATQSVKERAVDEARIALSKAKQSDGQEGSPETFRPNEWIQARN